MPTGPSVYVQAVPPGKSWEQLAGVDVPLPAYQILSRVVGYEISLLIGQTVKQDLLLATIQHSVARAFLVQAQMRMIAQDMSKLDELARALTIELDGTGRCVVDGPDWWLEAADRALGTRKCQRCGATIPGTPHTRSDCDLEMARDVMES